MKWSHLIAVGVLSLVGYVVVAEKLDVDKRNEAAAEMRRAQQEQVDNQRAVDNWWNNRELKRIEAENWVERELERLIQQERQQARQQEALEALEAQRQALDSIAESTRQQLELQQQREDRIQAYYRCIKQGGARRECIQ